ncbi:MAG: hypothetical protein KC475_03115 [Cyanobacteria bacterium HKST-UBA03]|nr:hypothetical protein [Cyanobacteria bacterium HKST-UBA03]
MPPFIRTFFGAVNEPLPHMAPTDPDEAVLQVRPLPREAIKTVQPEPVEPDTQRPAAQALPASGGSRIVRINNQTHQRHAVTIRNHLKGYRLLAKRAEPDSNTGSNTVSHTAPNTKPNTKANTMELQSASASRRRPASVGSGPVLDSASDQVRPASMEALMQADDLKASLANDYPAPHHYESHGQ